MIVLKVLLGIIGTIIAALMFIVILVSASSLFVNPEKEYDKHSNYFRFLLVSTSMLAMKILRIRVHVTGLEKVPTDTKNILFTCNHISNYDPIVTWVVLRHWKPSFLSKASNFKLPVYGRLIRRCCFMEIDREDARKAIATVNRASNFLKEGDISVAVYPEGTRSKTGELLPFHNGILRIAQKSNGSVAVMYIKGTEGIHKNYIRRVTDVYIDVIEVMDPAPVKSQRTEAMGEYIRSLMLEKQQNTKEPEGAEAVPA